MLASFHYLCASTSQMPANLRDLLAFDQKVSTFSP
jgi:hypothetical protein